MKIAMIGHKRVPSRAGGIEVVVGELASRMAAQGHQVTIYNRRVKEPRLRRWEGCRVVEVRTFANEKLNAFVYSFFATLRAIAGGYDVLHFHAEGPSCMIALAKLFRKRCVSTIHGLDWQRAKWGRFASAYLMMGERQAARRADRLIVLAAEMGRYFQRTYGRAADFIPNGVSRPRPRPPEVIGEKYGLTANGYLLFLARLTPEKGLHYLLEAYRQVEGGLPLVVAGGLEPETPYIKELRAMAALDPRVKLIGFAEGAALEELYSNCLLYILPSDVEGMAMSLLEAVSYGAPCLASDIPENRDIAPGLIRHFRRGDVGSLRAELEAVLSASGLREQMFDPDLTPEEVCRRREDFFRAHDWDEITRRTLELYQAAGRVRTKIP